MKSYFLARLAVVAAFVSPSASADTLVLGDRLVYGRLIAVESTEIRFAPNCGGEQLFPRSDVKQIDRNGACQPKPIRPYSAGGQICPTPPLTLYEVELKGPKENFLVSDAALADGRLHLFSVDGLTAYHGPDSRFVSMGRGQYCREAIADIPSLPGFCAETVQWAANFGPEPVFDNRILTRGVSFYLEDELGEPISPDDPRSIEIRNGFGNAVTLWIGALRDLGAELPPVARAAISSMESRSDSGYVLLLPPQVVRVGCPDTASFVVRYVSSDARSFSVGGQIKAARAQVEGRTIWINGATYPCWRAALSGELFFPLEEDGGTRCVNLTPILVHELGHAFGLAGHNDDPRTPSIMNSTIDPSLTGPTREDAFALADVLLDSITGAPAGRLDADGSGVAIRETSLKP